MNRPRKLWWACVVVASPLVGLVVHHTLGWPLHAHTLTGVAWALVGSPFVEEWVYRQAVQAPLTQHLLSRWPVARHGLKAEWCAMGAASACFVAVHMASHGVAGLVWVIPGALLAALYSQTRRLWLCVALHAWFNASLGLAGMWA